ncbi:MAG: ATP-binding protein [Rubricoccaceae bacterium]|nr:ATP-binding protein [Rubricoccaceae bacterium]
MARNDRHITIPSKTSQLSRVRRHVAAWSREAGLSEQATDALQLAVDEACANAIEHGYGGKGNGEVDVQAKLTKDAIVVTIRHHGTPFDPKVHSLAALSDMRSQRRPHGYGLHLMKRLVDDVVFRATGGGSEVRLTKRLS